jgi:Secretion system C-terminal sorting domain
MKTFFPFLITLSILFTAQAQQDPFQIYLEPVTIEGLPGIQSYAFGQHQGLWLIIGGRIDGLHRRQPWASFNPEGRNTQLIVIDPRLHKIWTAPLTSLPLHIQDQLSSTNMEFYQDGKYVYVTGGYGYSQTIDAKLTFAMLTAIDVPGAIAAVQNRENLSPYFRSITDVRFAVTGGHLNKIFDTYYLVGGQKFDGNYNPMNHPTFTQEYSNGIRKFRIEDDGVDLKVTHLFTITDTAAFHRRDYNVGPVIFSNGEEGLMSYSGPFQIQVDLPYLNVVRIDSQSYQMEPGFAQYYNNYHCAMLPLYAASNGEMHTVFFGGIAQYYEENGTLVQDNEVPFVKTIARITRDNNGQLTEYKLPVEMPGYLGASAEFIPLDILPKYANGVIKLDELDPDTALVGYIYGGISSSAANIFFINDGTESVAHPLIYKVYVIRNMTTSTHALNDQSHNGLQMQIYPNPNDGTFNIQFHLREKIKMVLTISDDRGKVLVKEDVSGQLLSGDNRIEQRFKPFNVGGIYFVTLTTPDDLVTQKIIVKE